MNHDPNLREAMDEIRAIMKRRNIGGHVLLASPTFIETDIMYDLPDWSVVSFEKQGIRIKARAASDKHELEKLEATTHMLCGFRDQLANGFLLLEKVIEHLSQHVEIDHKNRIGTSPDSVPGDDQ